MVFSMDQIEIFEYIPLVIGGLALGVCFYSTVMVVTEAFSTTLFHKKIQSQEELESIVREEAEKLGIDPSKIDAKYNGRMNGVDKNGERYELQIKGDFSTRPTVRHELYHVYKGDCGRTTRLKYWFIQEPRAKIYELLGIKL